MTSDNYDHDVPKVVLDDEDRQAYIKQRQAGKSKPGKTPPPEKTAKPRRGGAGLAIIALLLAIGAASAAGWLFTLTEQQQNQLEAYQSRIADLEGRLNATGEEMGESTVALQVKVKELTEKSEQLWEQMDKLWASAWRRNQAEIGDNTKKLEQLQTRINNVNNDNQQLQAALDKNSRQQETSVANLQEMFSVQQLNQEATLESVSRLSTDAKALEQQIRNLSDKINDSAGNNTALLRRVNQLEQKVETLSKLIQGPTS